MIKEINDYLEKEVIELEETDIGELSIEEVITNPYELSRYFVICYVKLRNELQDFNNQKWDELKTLLEKHYRELKLFRTKIFYNSIDFEISHYRRLLEEYLQEKDEEIINFVMWYYNHTN